MSVNPSPWTHYDDIVVGGNFSGVGRTITDFDVNTMTGLISGFHQPLHTDLEWVRANTPFTERLLAGPIILAYSLGSLSASLVYSGITMAFLGIERVRAKAPVYAGDTITATATVASKRLTSDPRRGVLELAVAVRSQREPIVMSYEYSLMVRGPEAVAAA